MQSASRTALNLLLKILNIHNWQSQRPFNFFGAIHEPPLDQWTDGKKQEVLYTCRLPAGRVLGHRYWQDHVHQGVHFWFLGPAFISKHDLQPRQHPVRQIMLPALASHHIRLVPGRTQIRRPCPWYWTLTTGDDSLLWMHQARYERTAVRME